MNRNKVARQLVRIARELVSARNVKVDTDITLDNASSKMLSFLSDLLDFNKITKASLDISIEGVAVPMFDGKGSSPNELPYIEDLEITGCVVTFRQDGKNQEVELDKRQLDKFYEYVERHENRLFDSMTESLLDTVR